MRFQRIIIVLWCRPATLFNQHPTPSAGLHTFGVQILTIMRVLKMIALWRDACLSLLLFSPPLGQARPNLCPLAIALTLWWCLNSYSTQLNGHTYRIIGSAPHQAAAAFASGPTLDCGGMVRGNPVRLVARPASKCNQPLEQQLSKKAVFF